jgi:hypothetical protein
MQHPSGGDERRRDAFARLACLQAWTISQGKSGIWCWHCCHPFDGPRIPLPVAYDERLDVWRTKAAFCSFACAKAWNHDNEGHRSGMQGMLLTLFKKRTFGTLEAIVPAPPRCLLAVFGGAMSIEEFRAASGEKRIVSVLPQKMVPLEQVVFDQGETSKRIESSFKRRPAPDLQTPIDLADAVSKNETLRLRRPPTAKKTAAKDVLQLTMGLRS